MSEAAGVGVSIAINSVSTDTRAYIGPEDPEDSSGGGGPTGAVVARKLDVEAVTDGRIESLSVAAAFVSSSPPKEPGPSFMDRKNKLSGALGKLTKKTTRTQAIQEANEGDNGGYGGQENPNPQSEPEFGLAVSGTASVNLGRLATEAFVYKGNLQLQDADSSLTVQALNDTHITAASGAAALARANNPSSEWSAAIAGAFALNQLHNTTSAAIGGSQVTGAKSVAVRALASGQEVAVALGTSVNLSEANPDHAGTAAGSVSVNLVENEIISLVESSTITGQDSGLDRSFDVVAYDRTRVGTGGGSLLGGGKAGVGAAVTFSSIANTVDAQVSGATVSNYRDVRVHGLTAALIGSGGAMAGFTKGEETATFGGAIVISTIENTTSAQILSDSSISVARNVSVSAHDTSGEAALDAIIDSRGERLDDELDYSGRGFLTGDEYEPGNGTTIVSVAGIAQVGGNNVGVSFAWNEVNNNFKALVSDSTINAEGDVEVDAYSGTLIIGLSIGAGLASGKFSGGASVTVNETGSPLSTNGNSITASVTKSTVNADSLRVGAADKTRIYSLAGQVSVSIGTASAGGAIAHNLVSNTVHAQLTASKVDVDTAVDVVALNDSAIRTVSAAAAGGDSLRSACPYPPHTSATARLRRSLTLMTMNSRRAQSV